MTLNRFARRIAGAFIACCSLITAAASPAAWAQDLSTGSLNVTVTDPAGAAVNGAKLELRDLETNDTHTSATKGAGNVVIPYLNPAHYILTVTKEGFGTKVYPSVTIQINQTTDLRITLDLGIATQSVSVTGDTAPILDTTSNALSSTLDLKQVQDLPLGGRDAFGLAFLVPGAVGNNFNNLPGGAVDVSSNGFSTMTNRNKSAGFDNDGSSTTNLLENVQEMTVQTSELDASHGGTSTMDIGFVTMRGTNRYHGQLFEDYRSDALNANSWYNNATGQARGALIINDFGGSVGGPALKDKLFFFLSLSNFREPVTYTHSTAVATPLALTGVYQFTPTNTGATTQSVNVLQAGAGGGCSTCTGAINPAIASALANVQSTYSSSGATLTPLDLNHDDLNFPVHEGIVIKYPTARLDYNLTQNFRLTGTVTETNSYYTDQGAPPYPGPLYANQGYSNFERNYQAVAGFDWNIKPDLVNAFRAGYLYTGFVYNSQGINVPTPEMSEVDFGFNMTSGINGFNSLRGGSLYPVFAVKDDSTWQRGRHTLAFGFDMSTEIDHYYNNQFVPDYGVNGIASGDPVTNSLTNSLTSTGVPAGDLPGSAVGDVEGLYATLTGRMNYYDLGQFINIKTKQFQPDITFNLHEKLTQYAVFAMDSWKVKPSFTVNYGLRWDFTGASTDETGFYTHPNIANFWGPSGVGNIFKPGTLTGIQNPVEGPASQAYAPTYVHPEPNVGFAWNPSRSSDTWMGKLLGDGKTVIRGSYTFKNYTEGAQSFWNYGSNFGANFNTTFVANPVAPGSSTPGAGFYNAGSVSLGNTVTATQVPATVSTSPIPYQQIISFASQAFTNTSYFTFDPHIKQPYVESWQFGIQRQLSPNNVLEVRYVGNVAKDQWFGINYNEVNIFENGFLKEFQAAQANLAASGGTTFQGAQPTPILSQAFAATGATQGFTNGQFITWLQQGQAGAFANALAKNPSYLCSLVGATNLSPCAAAGASGTGSYPINFFQANPYAPGANIEEMTNAGFSNYNALQIDFRQRLIHGMQFNANYTLAHSLGTSIQGSTAPGAYGGGGNNNSGNSAPGYYTLRNPHLNYFPSSFDVRHVLHISGTYDLPFGHSQPFFNQNRIANSIIGGWTIGTILTYESGDPHLFTGGTQTVNVNNTDSGLTLTGVTASQLQKQIRIRPSNGHPWVNLFDSRYYNTTSGESNTASISPNYNAGQFGNLLWLHDPKWINTDMALTKVIPIYKEMNFKLQGEFLNVFNHVAWSGADTGVQDTTFGTTSGTANGPRNIELRGNFRF
jgi:hypothetical protein